MSHVKFIYSILFTLVSALVIAQEGKVEVIKDPRLDALIRSQEDKNIVNGIPQVPGFRVQLIFDSDKKKIDNLRARFIAQNAGVDTYVIYNAPNYVLKAGNFMERADAQKLRDQSLKLFPTAFIVKEMINMPRIEDQ